MYRTRDAHAQSSTEPYPLLPREAADTIARSRFFECVTFTTKGEPLNSPMLHFVGRQGDTCDGATGLGYPAKAERVRRNPHVALLFEGEGMPREPVVMVRALAAVRDSDIQANTDRYVEECLDLMLTTDGGRSTWEQISTAIWYWARIWIECTPVEVSWWPDNTELDTEPQRWLADRPWPIVQSDPAPPDAPSPAPSWPLKDWVAQARKVMRAHPRPHLSMVDGEFPSVIRVRSCELVGDQFHLDVPPGAPGDRSGKVSVCFGGRSTFMGDAVSDGQRVRVSVDRILPVLPLIETGVFQPDPGQRDAILVRLDRELARRNQPRPRFNGLRPETAAS